MKRFVHPAVLAFLGLVLAVAAPFAADSAPSLAIEGRVIDDESGEPIPYVNVGVPGAAVGTVSDQDGRFTLSGVPADADVVFSAIGFKKRTVAAEAISEDAEVRLTPHRNRVPRRGVGDGEGPGRAGRAGLSV